MARKLKWDKVLFVATLLLVAGSIVMVYSAAAAYGPALFLTKQAMWAALGLVALLLAMRIDYHEYTRPAVIWSLLGFTALALVAVLFRAQVGGSRRWFGIGPIGIQPSEFAKLVTVVFVAAVLERRMKRIDEPIFALTPVGIVVGMFAALILLEPDFGSATALAAIAVVMVFAAGLSYRYLAGFALCALPLVASVLWLSPYRRKRVLAFLDPWQSPLGDGFQVIQSFIAVGTGGVSGKGLSQGVQKLKGYLPAPHTDFIYSVIAEELGLIGATVVLACFCVIAWRGLMIARRAPDSVGALLAVGLTTMVAVQAFINISVVLGLLPTKGIALPFVSAGGSSLLVNMLGVGILLNVSQQASASQ